MYKRHLVVGYRFFFALLALAAIAAQYAHVLARPGSNVNFFLFFTIESNMLAVITLAVSGWAVLRGSKIPSLDSWRGAATLYMVITGIIYVLLLSGLEESLQTPIPWINAVLHYIMPLAVFLDWCLWRPKRAIPFRRALPWLLFPVVYGMFSLVRGHFAHWYPYPFLNPGSHGYAGIAITSVCIAIFALLLIAALTWVTRVGRPDRTTKR